MVINSVYIQGYCVYLSPDVYGNLIDHLFYIIYYDPGLYDTLEGSMVFLPDDRGPDWGRYQIRYRGGLHRVYRGGLDYHLDYHTRHGVFDWGVLHVHIEALR